MVVETRYYDILEVEVTATDNEIKKVNPTPAYCL